MNFTQIYPKKEKQPDIKITKIIVQMSQFDDDEKKKHCRRGKKNRKIL